MASVENHIVVDGEHTPDEDLSLGAIFPEAPRPPTPEPTHERYVRDPARAAGGGWSGVDVRLVGAHPLWGHHLWNAARAFATFLDADPALYRAKNVLELGAGAGLPGLVCALNGAGKVVLTDYPDHALVANLWHNVAANLPTDDVTRVDVQGYIWGRPVGPLLQELPQNSKFDLIILSDLIFNHSQHDAMLTTCEDALSASHADALAPEHASQLLVFYTHHRPQYAERDMGFFDKARARGWVCDEIVTETYAPMFPDDPGAEDVRATVHGWRLTRGAA